MIQKTANEGRSQICAQCPRSVGVAYAESEVGNVAQHRPFVNEAVARIDRRAIDRELYGAQSQHLQTSGGDDDVGIELLAGLQADAMLGKGIDLVGNDRGASCADGLEQVGVGNQAQALILSIS